MKKSETIQQQIDDLIKVKNEILEEESITKIWDDNFISTRNIGCFKITKLETLLRALNSKRILMLKHSCLGKWIVGMNPQGNSLSVEPWGRPRKPFSTNVNEQEPVNYNNIINLMVNASGDWYVLDGELADKAFDLLFMPF